MEKTDPGVDDISDYQDLAAAQSEIETFSAELAGFGLSLTDVADSCPRQERTLDACMKVLDYAKKHPELLEQMIRSRKLPLSQLALGSGAEKRRWNVTGNISLPFFLLLQTDLKSYAVISHR